MKGASFSGHERNHLFLNLAGRRFQDASGLSGLDSQADGRSFAVLDFDRDGWLDLVVVNANAPTTQLFHNRAGRLREGEASRNGILALRFAGANDRAVASPTRSNRDGFGARVEIDLGDLRLVREHRAGDGFAAQNSATLQVGIGPRERVEALTVHWPSGAVQRVEGIAAGQLVTLYEDARQSPDGSGVAREPYGRDGAVEALLSRPAVDPPRPVFPLHAARQTGGEGPALTVYTTTATWCDACRGELPQWRRLRAALGPGELEIVAVPVDEDDTAQMLGDYIARHRPDYRMLPPLSEEERNRVRETVARELGREGLPASFLTDRAGHVIDAFWGAPSLSRLRAELALRGTPAAGLAAAPQRRRRDS